MASEVDIANSALRKVGQKTAITALDEGTEAASAVNNIFATSRDTVLRAHLWNFAMRRQELARLSATPAFEYDYQFSMPTDYLRLKQAFDNSAGVGTLDCRLESTGSTDKVILLSSAPRVWASYVAQITNTTLMPPDFREAFAFYMAIDLAVTLVDSRSLSEAMEKRYDRALRRAKSSDAMEDMTDRFPEGSWVTSRGGQDEWA